MPDTQSNEARGRGAGLRAGVAEVGDYLKFDPVPPIIRQIKRVGWGTLRRDTLAGLMVAIVAIPQAIGFAVVVGIPVKAVIATGRVTQTGPPKQLVWMGLCSG